MVSQVIINGRAFQVKSFHQEKVFHESENKNQLKINFTFEVTSEEYHDVTTLLYENDFTVLIPENKVQFQATIQQYATSLTNLYKENQVSEYQLALVETV